MIHTSSIRRAIVIAGVATMALASAEPVAAARDDHCADLAHQAQVELDIAHGWWVLGNTLNDLGLYDQADDAYAYADYFFAAWDVHSTDSAC